MLRPTSVVLLSVALLLGPIGSPAAADPRIEGAARGVSFIVSRQQDTGAFSAPGQSPDMTAEFMLGLVAAGGPRESVDRALGHVRERGPDAITRAGHAGRIVSGIVAAGSDPRRLGGTDYVAAIRSFYDPATGSYDAGNLYANALAVLGLAAAGDPVPERALTYLRVNQCTTGGWSHAPGCAQGADTDSTALVVSALIAAGESPDPGTTARARSWLRDAQRDDAGWGVDAAKTTNANSTALAVSALVAMGEDIGSWQRSGRGPVDALLALQLPSGGVRYTGAESKPNDYATAQALVGLALRSYPIRPGPRAQPATAGTSPAPRPVTRAQATTQSQDRTQTPDGGLSPPPASGSVRVGLLVRSPDEQHELCPEVEEGSSGYDVLTASGLPLEVRPFGDAVFMCSIDGTGCDVRSCTDCEPDTFWGYWTRDPGQDGWTFSEVGATDRRPPDGAADAWVWGRDGGPPPPDDLDATAICSSAPAAAASPPVPRAASDERGRASGPLAAAVVLALLGAGAAALIVRRRRLAP